MKKITIFNFFLLALLAVNTIHVIGDVKMDYQGKDILLKHSVINESNNETGNVSRKECLVAIMKCIGATAITDEVNYETDYNTAVFNDVSQNEKESGYIWIAGLKRGHQPIAYGVCTEYDKLFLPSQDVKLKEAVAFMMRCLDNESPVCDEAYKRAQVIGLIRDTDIF